MKRIFVLDGHPAATSISRQWAQTYANSARTAGHDVRIAHLAELNFDADFQDGDYSNFKPLEPDLETVMTGIEWADHIVVAFPLWWGGLPAKLKGLFDRAFLPGRTFDPRNPNRFGMPSPMLNGRTARMMVSSDTPRWFLRLAYRSAIIHQTKSQIFGFVGIKPARFSWYSGASHADSAKVKRWLIDARNLGASAA